MKQIDDLNKSEIGCIQMLQSLFQGTSFEKEVPGEFLRQLEKAKEVLSER